jgi:hypothetical protein
VVSVAGQTIVNTPSMTGMPPYNVAVKARVVGGQICVNGFDVAHGLGAQSQPQYPVGKVTPASPTLTLDVHQMFGQILINGQGCSHGTSTPQQAPQGPQAPQAPQAPPTP